VKTNKMKELLSDTYVKVFILQEFWTVRKRLFFLQSIRLY